MPYTKYTLGGKFRYLSFHPEQEYFMFKKSVFVLAFCICVMLFTLTASADTVSLGTVNADALNVRSAPTTQSYSMGLLPYGSQVVITGIEGNWYKIHHNGNSAYVSADYIIVTATNVEYDFTPAASTYTPNYYGTGVPSFAGSQVPGEKLVEIAKQYVGTPYVYGGMSPSGFDCSGFVKYCYGLMNVSLNRIASDQAFNGYEVSSSQMLPGDIICFATTPGGSNIGHVGIYVGNGYFIHSPRTGYTVEIIPVSSSWYAQRIKTVRRIF